MRRKDSMFFKPKHKGLAKKISIKSPRAFRRSVRKLKENGLTALERRALTLAQNRAKAQLKRKNLSKKERKQMRKIGNIKF